LCRLKGTTQIAAVNGLNVLVGQGMPDSRGLPSTCVVQINVEVALNAGVHIPKRFTVADGENSGGLHRVKFKDPKIMQNSTIVLLLVLE
jgi:hypothetical protein